MKRSSRFATVFLLAGLVQVFLTGASSAQNVPWQFSSRTDPLTDEITGRVLSVGVNGGFIGFSCVMGNSTEKFLASGRTQKFDQYPEGQVEVAWRTDEGAVRRYIWDANPATAGGGVRTIGQNALEFALSVMRAQSRVVFDVANKTVVYDASGSTKAISQLLEFCGLKQ